MIYGSKDKTEQRGIETFSKYLGTVGSLLTEAYGLPTFCTISIDNWSQSTILVNDQQTDPLWLLH